jgi:hypothetical protein
MPLVPSMVSTPESDRHRGLHRRAKARRPSDDAPAERDLIVADDENVFANKKRGSNFRFRVYSDPEDSVFETLRHQLYQMYCWLNG